MNKPPYCFGSLTSLPMLNCEECAYQEGCKRRCSHDTAPGHLFAAAGLLEDRGKEYDQPEGERSMARAVSAWCAITRKEMTESEGWLLLQMLKDARQWQNPERYHVDSALDCTAYSALKAEALAKQKKEAV